VFGVVHPLLLWGAAAVAVPVLIHLLLRQRPRPRPWAAMRWLLAALQRAQRRYKLTNLLLLLLRCLAVLLAALAVARPSLAGLGQGGQLVLVVDCTASMGGRGGDPGPLAGAKAQLAKADLPARVVVVAVAERVRVVADGGLDEALAALERLAAEPIPGGLDRAAAADGAAALLAACPASADVVLVSDFQQDDGDLLAALLSPRVRSLTRWATGMPTSNALVAGIDSLPDPEPGLPGELLLQVVGGDTGVVRLAVDGGPAAPAGEGRRVSLPPLDAGEHRLTVELSDNGLVYDNRLELPLTVRGPVPTLIVEDHPDYLGAALLADAQHFEAPRDHLVRPAQLAQATLPARGLVALRARSGDGQRLAGWVQEGGVLWAPLAVLRDEPGLAALVAGITAAGDGGEPRPYRSGDADLDEILAAAKPAAKVPGFALPVGAETLLASGDAPVAVALPAGRGWLAVELMDLAGDQALAARGTTPLWVRRVARRLLSRPLAPRLWEAGAEAPAAAVLRRAGLVHRLAKGDPLLLPPGAWQAEDGPTVVILPNRSEGRLDKRAPPAASGDLASVLPRRAGADWGLPLLVALLVVLLVESALAAWAGRAYGR
jgi:hypothetical protein